jgi:hypothetical protein
MVGLTLRVVAMMPQSSCRAHSTLSMMVVALFVLGSFSRDTPIFGSALKLKLNYGQLLVLYSYYLHVGMPPTLVWVV